jgi:hypothetical protein
MQTLRFVDFIASRTLIGCGDVVLDIDEAEAKDAIEHGCTVGSGSIRGGRS